MPDEFDSYAPGSNLKEDYDGTITAASFEKGESGRNNNYSFHAVITADDGDEVEGFYGLGSDWQSYDGGSSVEHPKGAQRKFNGQTAYSEFLVFAAFGFSGDVNDVSSKANRPPHTDEEKAACIGAYQKLREIDRAHEYRGAQFAEPWVGMRFHFDVLKRPGRERVVVKAPDGSALIGSDGEEVVEWKNVERERMLPVRFLGMAAEQVAQTHGGPGTSLGSPTTAPAQTSNAQPSTPAATEAVGTSEQSTQGVPGAGVHGPLSHKSLADLPNQDRLKIVQVAKQNDVDKFVDEVCRLTTSDGRNMLDVSSVMDGLGEAEDMWKALRS